jgi:hypothetical protein
LARVIKAFVDSRSDAGEADSLEMLDFMGEADRLVELVEALDNWISQGGFLPKAWKK